MAWEQSDKRQAQAMNNDLMKQYELMTVIVHPKTDLLIMFDCQCH